MSVLAWFLFVILVISLTLLAFFIFNVLLPSIKNENTESTNPVFSEKEIKYVIPEDEPKVSSEKRALVLCSANKTFKGDVTEFNPKHTCRLVSTVYNSGSDCKFACIGLGDCVKACPQEAIEIVNHTAVINNLCIGCGDCLSSCPKNIIHLVPKETNSYIVCNNGENSLTSCSCLRKEEKIERKPKKGFKIWAYCYKIIKH